MTPSAATTAELKAELERLRIKHATDSPPTIASLLAPLPKPRLSVACPTDYCKVSVQPPRAAFEKLEKLAMRMFESRYDGFKISFLIHEDEEKGMLLPITRLMESLKNDNLLSEENQEALRSFRLAVRAVFKGRFKLSDAGIFRAPAEAVNHTGILLIRAGEGMGTIDPCICVVAKHIDRIEQALTNYLLSGNPFEEYQIKQSVSIPATRTQSRPAMLNRIGAGWKNQQFKITSLPTFVKHFDAVVLELVQEVTIAKDLLDLWRWVRGCTMFRNVQEQIRYGDSILGFEKPGQIYTPTFDVAGSVATTLRVSTTFGLKPESWLPAASKESGDDAFKSGKFKDSICCYSRATFLEPDNFVCYANSAAARLRLADADPTQYPQAIADCTYALEFSPNYLKALFRRGLALAKLKLWKKAILDFERAIELDPRSPAVAELAEAKKHV